MRPNSIFSTIIQSSWDQDPKKRIDILTIINELESLKINDKNDQ